MPRRVDAVMAGLCGPEHPAAPLLRAWGAAEPAFLAFAAAHDSKIRRKLRQASAGDALLDVLAELGAARFWLADRRFQVAYEPHRAAGGRSADLGVTFKGHTSVNVEVTRLRDMRLRDGGGNGSALDVKLARALGAKAGQLAAGAANLLVVALPPDGRGDSLLESAFRHLNGGTVVAPDLGRAFQRGRPRLSGALLASLDDAAGLRAGPLWRNTRATHPLPEEVAHFLAR